LRDGRDGRRGCSGERQVVEADESHVFGYAFAERLKGRQQRRGLLVVSADDDVGTMTASEDGGERRGIVWGAEERADGVIRTEQGSPASPKRRLLQLAFSLCVCDSHRKAMRR